VARVKSLAQSADIKGMLNNIQRSANQVKALAQDIVDATIMQLNIETGEILETATETNNEVKSMHEAMAIVARGVTALNSQCGDIDFRLGEVLEFFMQQLSNAVACQNGLYNLLRDKVACRLTVM